MYRGFIFKKMFSSKIEKVLLELEALDKNVLAFGVPRELLGHYIPRDSKFLWSVPRSTGMFLHELVLMYQPNQILEVGTSAGYSTIWLASAAQSYGGHVHTIERFAPKVELARKYIEQAGLSSGVSHYSGDASAVFSSWGVSMQFDFVFMDANKKQYVNHLKLIESFLIPGALIVADNILDHPEMVSKYVDYVTGNEKYDSMMLNIDNGLLISRMKIEG